jgi:hypothetical protein
MSCQLELLIRSSCMKPYIVTKITTGGWGGGGLHDFTLIEAVKGMLYLLAE